MKMRTIITVAALSAVAASCGDGGYQPLPPDSTTDALDAIDAVDAIDVTTDGGCTPGSCPPGTECIDGLCRGPCTTDGDCPGVLTCCEGYCYNTASEPYHCGECGNRCLPEGNACLSGVCSCNGAAPCSTGLTCCLTGGCLDTRWDRENCGDCGVRCAADQQCLGGECGGSCADHGCPEVPHGTAVCDGTECVIDDCEDGWVDADGLFENGCECATDVLDNGGPNCLDAYYLGAFADSPMSSTTVQGFISSAEPEDWYYFTATDTPDTDCDTFKVQISFTANPDDAHQFDVYLGACSGTNVCDDDVLFDVDLHTRTSVAGEEVGECPCNPTEPHHGENLCTDNTADYYLVVHLAEGASTTGCEPYVISITNGI
jgi:hypothetical protein